MDTILIAVLAALAAVVIGSGLGFQLHNLLSAKSQRAVEEASAQQMRRSNARSKEILLEAKEQALQVRSDAEAMLNEQKLEIQHQQSRLEALAQRSLDLESQTARCLDAAKAVARSMVEYQAVALPVPVSSLLAGLVRALPELALRHI